MAARREAPLHLDGDSEWPDTALAEVYDELADVVRAWSRRLEGASPETVADISREMFLWAYEHAAVHDVAPPSVPSEGGGPRCV